ncbi:MAG TPA: SLBB domain-containing protein, partial [Planctomycetota bacterium]|nr:SLBB domain-containing protein [Planctomycetota bacterium]
MRQATVLPRGRGDLAIVLRAVVRRGSLLFAGLVAFSLATSGKLSAQDAETLERLQRGIQTPRGIEDSELRALESLERRGLTGENARRRLRLEAPGDFEAGASADSRTRDDEREQGEGAGRSGASKDASAGSEGNGGGESAAGARARRLASEELERLSAFERQLLAYEDPLVGRPVRQFGYDVFGTPRTGIGRPVVDADYVIDVGDELAVSLWGQAVDDDYQVRVDARGDVRLPLVGVVSVRGLTLAQATAAMRAVFDEKFQDYEIRVRLVGRAREMHVHVVGRIERPGRVAVAWGASLFDAIAAAGGITKDGSLRRIRLRRAGEDDRTIDLYDYLLAGDPAVDVELARDDVILVPPIGAQVAIVGRVRRAAIYELEGESLEWSGLLDLAGGFARLADRSTIQVESVTESGLSVRAVELEGEDVAAADLSFRDGDVVLVRAAHPRVERVVYVAGNVSLPGRYAWREGMRVSDLIDENVLVDAGFWRGRIAPDSAPSELELPEPYLEFALLRRIDARTSQERRIAFHLGRALAEKGGREDHLLEPQDTIVIYPRDAFEAPLMTFVSGAVHQPGDHRWFPGMRVSDLVR